VRESCIEPFKVCEVFNGCLFLSPRREGAKTPRFVEKFFFVMLTRGRIQFGGCYQGFHCEVKLGSVAMRGAPGTARSTWFMALRPLRSWCLCDKKDKGRLMRHGFCISVSSLIA